MLASEFASRLNAQKTSSGWQARCPGHDDKNASLSISAGNDGRVLLKCHAGCGVKDIVSAMGLKMPDLFNDNAKKAPTSSLQPSSKKIVATYPYRDADGTLLYEVVRYEPKSFRQRRPDGNKGWIWNLQGVECVPYRLPELLTAVSNGERVFIVEGEKDAEALVKLGLCATCNSGGAGKWQDSFNESLRGADVVIVPDNDEPGRKHGQLVAGALHGKASRVRIVELKARPGLTSKVKDAHDWISAGGTRDELEAIVTATPEWMPSSEAITPEKPIVCLPGGAQTISATGAELGKLMGATLKFFIWGGTLVKLSYSNDKQIQLEMVKPCGLASDFESVAMLVKPDSSPTVCSEQIAKTVSVCESFKNVMPVIKVLSRCPVLVQRSDGTLEQVTGYDRESGIYADGEPVDMMELGQALPLLHEMLDGFCFATPSDKARALASLITPALVLSGLLPGRAPIDLGEANDSQAGKGYRNKLVAALYAQEVRTITQQKSGVGSMEESFNAALIRGSNFICLDNVRGKIDSPAFESFMTENFYSARVPYRENVEIDPRRVIVMMTSNKAEMTVDLANRCSTIRILKQPAGFEFKPYPEGDLLEHVKANRKKFLGAVFSVVKAWHAAGKPRSSETRHDFRAWVQILDWIVQNLLGAGPIMDGHRATQERMTNPSLNWLRDVALEAVKAKKLGIWLQAKDILEFIAETDMETALCTGEQHVMGEDVRKAKLQAIGRKMKACFRSDEPLNLDGIIIERSKNYDNTYRKDVMSYRFSAPNAKSDQGLAGPGLGAEAARGAEIVSEPVKQADLLLCRSYGAPMAAPIKPLIAPNAPGDSELIESTDSNSNSIVNISSMGPLGALGAEHGSDTVTSKPLPPYQGKSSRLSREHALAQTQDDGYDYYWRYGRTA